MYFIQLPNANSTIPDGKHILRHYRWQNNSKTEICYGIKHIPVSCGDKYCKYIRIMVFHFSPEQLCFVRALPPSPWRVWGYRGAPPQVSLVSVGPQRSPSPPSWPSSSSDTMHRSWHCSSGWGLFCIARKM
ncbi:hypothetical protein JZ751_020278 [Albula glossodonta]|uniref:Uncharacterized protein n=1 Tax=Albula glossodonta TaxID=121402 RepID=A0A8T2MQ21_9TELE|nr:hypothetical protein JZ751_030020 [Albula glossodonta]KAG9331080.1 hypothetical protein JZ751_020278 [Albula glossodonta]